MSVRDNIPRRSAEGDPGRSRRRRVDVPLWSCLVFALSWGCSAKTEPAACADGYGRDVYGNCVRLDDSGAVGDTDASIDSGADSDTDSHSETGSLPDADSDGYAEDVDCNDLDPAVNPEAVETCDTAYDDDCDGDVNDPGSVGCTPFYVDSDGDGFGGDAGACLCASEGEYAAAATGDCDDVDADVNPGASEECGNGVDDNCDGLWTECRLTDRPLGAADALFTGEDSQNYAGEYVAGIGDVNDDGVEDIIVGARYNDDAGEQAGAAYVVYGGAGVHSMSLAEADVKFTGAVEYDRMGTVAAVGDLSGDGVPDIAMSAKYADVGGEDAGSVYIFAGGTSLGSASVVDADAVFYGSAAGDLAGRSFAGAADFTGDGSPDFVVGAYQNDSGAVDGGAVYVISEPWTASDSLAAGDVEIWGEIEADGFGWVVDVLDDFDGDGTPDLAIGARWHDEPGSSAGACYLYLGDLMGGVSSAEDADAVFTGEAAGDVASSSIASAGDFNGDGRSDLMVSAIGNDSSADEAGAVYIILGTGAPLSLSLSAADGRATGAAAGDQVDAVASAGDLDGDGFDDVVVGAVGVGDSYTGAAYLLAGGPTVSWGSLADADAEFTGESSSDNAGYAVAGAGDFNGDLIPDILVGAYVTDDPLDNIGTTYVIFGTGP